MPTVAPAILNTAPEEGTAVEPPPIFEETVRDGRVNAWDHWVSAAPGQSPEQLAATIVSAALANDELNLNTLFVGMGAGQQPTARMWLSIANRCLNNLSSSDFVYTRHPIPLPTITSISVWYNGVLVSEIKMRQIRGEWFATFTRAPALNPCLLQ